MGRGSKNGVKCCPESSSSSSSSSSESQSEETSLSPSQTTNSSSSQDLVGCNPCTHKNASKYLLVTISGLTNNVNCSGCASLNGVYLVKWTGPDSGGGDTCTWSSQNFSHTCFFGGYNVNVTLSNVSISVQIVGPFGGNRTCFFKTITPPIECMNMDETVPPDHTSSPLICNLCDVSGATCRVQSV